MTRYSFIPRNSAFSTEFSSWKAETITMGMSLGMFRLSQFVYDRKSMQSRHRYIQQDQIGLLAMSYHYRLFSVQSCYRLVAKLPQLGRQHAYNPFIVVNY